MGLLRYSGIAITITTAFYYCHHYYYLHCYQFLYYYHLQPLTTAFMSVKMHACTCMYHNFSPRLQQLVMALIPDEPEAIQIQKQRENFIVKKVIEQGSLLEILRICMYVRVGFREKVYVCTYFCLCVINCKSSISITFFIK